MRDLKNFVVTSYLTHPASPRSFSHLCPIVFVRAIANRPNIVFIVPHEYLSSPTLLPYRHPFCLPFSKSLLASFYTRLPNFLITLLPDYLIT